MDSKERDEWRENCTSVESEKGKKKKKIIRF